MLNILKFIWQLPQNTIALVYYLHLLKCNCLKPAVGKRGNVRLYTKDTPGCVTLGNYVFLAPRVSNSIIKHELGHTKQSLWLGPLYLLVIGIPSIVWAATHNIIAPGKSYYSFYTEKWANKISNVNLK